MIAPARPDDQRPKRKPPIADATQEEIVKLYKAGHSTAEITRRTRVPRGSIYYVLKRKKVPTNRLGQTDGKPVTLAEQISLNRQLEQELTEVQAERDRLSTTLDTLLARLGLTPAKVARLINNPTRQPATKGKP